jgi:hypothetical protein
MRAKERAPTPSASVVFTLKLAVESIKELGGASKVMVKHERHHIFIFSYLLYEFLMYKFGTLIFEYSFVFSLRVNIC